MNANACSCVIVDRLAPARAGMANLCLGTDLKSVPVTNQNSVISVSSVAFDFLSALICVICG